MAIKRNAIPAGPPFADHTTEYETHLLGSYLMGAAIGTRVTGAVFASGAHRVIFQAVKDLKDRGVEPDLLTLTAELEKRGQLDAAGGPANVAALTNAMPSAANVGFYEGEVLAAYRARSVWRAAVSAKEAIERREAPDGVVTRLAAELETAAGNGAADECEFIDGAELYKKQFPPENSYVEGLLSGGLTILSGSPKTGKSWLCLQMVAALSCGGAFMGSLRARKCGVILLALEDTQRRLAGRMRKQQCGADSYTGSRFTTKRPHPCKPAGVLKSKPSN